VENTGKCSEIQATERAKLRITLALNPPRPYRRSSKTPRFRTFHHGESVAEIAWGLACGNSVTHPHNE